MARECAQRRLGAGFAGDWETRKAGGTWRLGVEEKWSVEDAKQPKRGKSPHEIAVISPVKVPFPHVGQAAMVQSDVVHGCNVRRVC